MVDVLLGIGELRLGPADGGCNTTREHDLLDGRSLIRSGPCLFCRGEPRRMCTRRRGDAEREHEASEQHYDSANVHLSPTGRLERG
jgi:hypothetical protein